MDYIPLTPTWDGFQIHDIPGGVQVIELDGPIAKRLSDLALHKQDLEFAKECLNEINSPNGQTKPIRTSLWLSAIIHLIKCFGDGARFQLSAEKILKGQPKEALDAFEYFKAIRNKHIIHDENSYAQSTPGAILNDGNKSYKVEKIICLLGIADTLNQDDYSNLFLLIDKSHEWVVTEFDLLCGQMKDQLEAQPYQILRARNPPTYKTPTLTEVYLKRATP